MHPAQAKISSLNTFNFIVSHPQFFILNALPPLLSHPDLFIFSAGPNRTPHSAWRGLELHTNFTNLNFSRSAFRLYKEPSSKLSESSFKQKKKKKRQVISSAQCQHLSTASKYQLLDQLLSWTYSAEKYSGLKGMRHTKRAVKPTIGFWVLLNRGWAAPKERQMQVFPWLKSCRFWWAAVSAWLRLILLSGCTAFNCAACTVKWLARKTFFTFIIK